MKVKKKKIVSKSEIWLKRNWTFETVCLHIDTQYWYWVVGFNRNNIPFVVSLYTVSVPVCNHLSEDVFHVCCYLTKMKILEEQHVYTWNFVSNWAKHLHKLCKCCKSLCKRMYELYTVLWLVSAFQIRHNITGDNAKPGWPSTSNWWCSC